jgi:hypothetical protein
MSEYRIDISENILLQDEDFVETKIKINKNIQKIRKNIEDRKKKVTSEFINKRVEKIQNNRMIILLNSLQEYNQTVYSNHNKSSQ